MDDSQILDAFKQCDALRKGHFVLTSGLHSDSYIQCARVLEHPGLTNQLAREAVSRLPGDLAIDMVASPAVGGILYGFAVAAALDTSLVFSERVEGRMTLRRSFVIPEGARVLIAEDVVTTGGSVKELIALVNDSGAVPAAVISMVDRGKTPDFGCPYYPLITIDTPSWRMEDCNLCKEDVKIESLGSRNHAKGSVKP